MQSSSSTNENENYYRECVVSASFHLLIDNKIIKMPTNEAKCKP